MSVCVAEMRDGTFTTVVAPPAGLPLAETAPGVYTGERKCRLDRTAIRARSWSDTGANGKAATSTVDGVPFAVDAALTVAVAA